MKTWLIGYLLSIPLLLQAQSEFLLLPQDKMCWENAALANEGALREFRSNYHQTAHIFFPAIRATNLSYNHRVSAQGGSLGGNALTWLGKGHFGTAIMGRYSRNDSIGNHVTLRSGLGLGHIGNHVSNADVNQFVKSQTLFNVSLAAIYKDMVLGLSIRQPNKPQLASLGYGLYASYRLLLGRFWIKPVLWAYRDKIFIYHNFGIEVGWNEKHSFGWYPDFDHNDFGTFAYTFTLRKKLSVGIATNNLIRYRFGPGRPATELILRWRSLTNL